MIRAWRLRWLLVLGLCLVNPAWGSIFANNSTFCGGTYPDTFAPLLPPDHFNIPTSGQTGDFFGPWYSSYYLGNSVHGFPFFICASWDTARNNSTGAEDNLYVLGLKPATVYASTDLASKDGYTVFTTSELSDIGIGFILRWRVHAQDSGIGGAWRSPSATWSIDDPPLSAGVPFYRFPAYSWTQTFGNYWLNQIGENNFSSVAQYRDAMDTVPAQNRGTNVFVYGAEVEVRYVLTKPASEIYGALDTKSGSITTDFVTLRARPLSYQINHVTVRQTTTFQLPPTGTCETPSWDGMIVQFPMIFPHQIPDPGDTAAEKTFDLTFIRCPRTNLGWFVHANNKWVNAAQGIVGLSGSTPNADPVIGNPRGFGVQLEHGSGSPDGSGPVVMSLHETDPNRHVYWRTPAQGLDTNTGVIHTIPLRARIIRTSPASEPITIGPFTTSVIVAIQYP